MEDGDHPPRPGPDLEARVEACLDALDGLSPEARAAGESLLAATVELHTATLTTLVQELRESGGDSAVERVGVGSAGG